MADQVTVDNGALTDYTVVTDEITSPYTGGSAQAQGMKIIDGTVNGATPAIVNAEGALLSGVGPGFDRQSTDSLSTAVNSAVTVDVDGASVVSFAIDTATSGAVDMEVTPDGTNWLSAYGWRDYFGYTFSGDPENLFSLSLSNVGDSYCVYTAGFRQVRMRVSSTLGASVGIAITASAAERPMTSVSPVGGFFQTKAAGDINHDAADNTGGGPVKIGGYAKAAAPADVSADGDRVNAWFLRNGAQATVITAAGALVGGDATNGLDVDVTRTVLPTIASGATVTSQNDQATNVTLLSSSATRKGFRIFNDSTVALYVKYGATATTSDYTVKLGPGDYLEENFYYGQVDGIWASDASGAAKITSLA